MQLLTSTGVNKSDYYSDTLFEFLLPFLRKQKKIRSVFEIGTGRGYLSILLAKRFPSITSILATDIDSTAISLARKNVELNGLDGLIKVSRGSLFVPAGKKRFDLIFSVPPQLPLTKEYVRRLIPRVESYHVTTSAGGKDGRLIVDKIINGATSHLNPYGILSFVHSDIIGLDKSLSKLESIGLRAILLGKKSILLKNTTLTRLSKKAIEKTGYRFKKNGKNQEVFEIGVIAGIYGQDSHQEYRSLK
ncbi:MAG: hypothetical protein UX88_C0025G0005 [Candidatus Woesebacteria bacterium GW2011_GWC2_47_16]|uniref:Methyltransferase small domain-containing protein n=6 Tax=Candidatus Woeseibacteriota TaxID=1752722 RepID=A0A1F8D569_9BACT|nr:MAG: hypothetical protein UW42_C0042G0003 [Candidatus Collierbacteria bacterium GW2011_GWB1_44_197]KKU03572.1 MAG: hypothetical protein UX03_C0017G0005 [Candidatus Woesebacteria bacterium GW2011_GWE1_45_18]KKU23041.1 MAG: hypothetical protein UX34_C0017G0004 [Candidatus Woesebacteria bacterium GW2011_GWF1_46_13]KKU63601.1 MAG: hypothetical protein UX88_C0025G0005 [Candidatus Woesebacteria bacterium GW2011_GWC2_47_16]OGM83764.1 MAG: hypothetical protein A2376_02460 [Candidatus Woesebacteria b